MSVAIPSPIKEAAAAIVALIHSSPRSPRVEEIEAVIARVGSISPAAMSPTHAAHYAEWRRLIEEHTRAWPPFTSDGGKSEEASEAADARMSAHLGTMDDLALRVFAVPARTWGDVLLFAEVCLWVHHAGIDAEAPQGRAQLHEMGFANCGDATDKALTALLEAVFTVAGIGQFAEARHA